MENYRTQKIDCMTNRRERGSHRRNARPQGNQSNLRFSVGVRHKVMHAGPDKLPVEFERMHIGKLSGCLWLIKTFEKIAVQRGGLGWKNQFPSQELIYCWFGRLKTFSPRWVAPLRLEANDDEMSITEVSGVVLYRETFIFQVLRRSVSIHSISSEEILRVLARESRGVIFVGNVSGRKAVTDRRVESSSWKFDFDQPLTRSTIFYTKMNILVRRSWVNSD